ncbi:MAG: hypothetical protein H6744_09220 [Deltaproteobacteria bacterium]|nr:hypothetical protein [Deltaproteobacteria bacterium]
MSRRAGLRRGAALLVGLLLALATACGRPARAPERQAEVAPGGTRTEAATASRLEAARAIAELKAAARRRLAADRAAASNRLGYEQSLARQRRDAQGTGMDERIPARPIDAAALESALASPVRAAGGRLRAVRLGDAALARPVPQRWDVEGPYPFEPEQIVARRPLAVEVDAPDEATLARIYEALRRAEGPLLDVDALRTAGGVATFVGAVYQRRDVQPPTHGVAEPSLDELARGAGVTVPEGHPGLSEVRALLAQDRALAAELGEALATLSTLDLESRVFQFYRLRAKSVATRRFSELTRDPTNP